MTEHLSFIEYAQCDRHFRQIQQFFVEYINITTLQIKTLQTGYYKIPKHHGALTWQSWDYKHRP